ncbi:MAG: hypothetical protein L7S49_02135 [Candidatus Poseidoniaceae archaeon]|nr:hypothetical protein [Candidatus Poseidoniaceae archaeon]
MASPMDLNFFSSNSLRSLGRADDWMEDIRRANTGVTVPPKALKANGVLFIHNIEKISPLRGEIGG